MIDYFALSVAQQRRWLEAKQDMASCLASRFFVELVLPDHINDDCFYQAVINAVQRHQLLRASLLVTGQNLWPVLHICDTIDFPPPPQIGQLVEMGNMLYGIVNLAEAGGTRILQLGISTVFIDGFSFNRLLQQLLSGVFEDSELDYLQFAAWQNDEVAGAEEQHQQFWQQRKQQALTASMPIRADIADHTDSSIGWFCFAQDGVAERLLDTLSRHWGVSRQDCALVCWLILLGRNSGQSQVTAGINHAVRSFEELNPLVGPMEAMVPLSVELAADTTFGQVIDLIDQDRRRVENHLACFSLGDPEQAEHRLSSGFRYDCFSQLTIKRYEVLDGSGDLLLCVADTDEQMHFGLSYRRDHYSLMAVQVLSAQWLILLGEMVDQPTARVSEWPVMDHRYGQMISGFNPPVSISSAETIPQRFAARVKADPDGIAVVDGVEQLSYLVLQQRAIALMTGIADFPGDRVGLLLEPGVAMVISMLGILMAGRSYVPLAADTPRLRLAHIIKDAEIGTVITQQSYHEHLSGFQCRLVLVEQINSNAENNNNGNDNAESAMSKLAISPQADAYHIYTSGTSGLPKGVSISHRALVNYVQWLEADFELDNRHRSALITSYAFDLGYTALWGTLLNGATLYLPDSHIVDDPQKMLTYIKDKSLTYLKVTPSLLRVWQAVEGVGLADCDQLKLLFCGGEAFDSQVIAGLAGSDCTLVNHYGPTETTIGAIACRFHASTLADFAKRPLLGRPIRNMKAVIVDPQGHSLPPGLEGRLFLAGEGVANGYISQALLWADKYRQQDFLLPGKLPSKWYDTGDNARWTATGQIEFLGRRDCQLKINGQRIELEEIETLLGGHPGVAETAVYQDPANPHRLLAMVVPHANALKRLCHLETSHLETSHLNSAEAHDWTVLPNGKLVFEVNRPETEFMYRELITESIYLRHGITVNNGDTVVDLGANIGLFSLSLAWQSAAIKLVSVEPAAAAFASLALNAALVQQDWQVFQLAVGASQGQCTLANYQHHTMLNTLQPDVEQDRALLLSLAMEKYHSKLDDTEQTALRHITDSQLQAEIQTCEMCTLSQLMQRADVSRIDLLKVDVQRTEWAVLCGIAASDWQKIVQIVMEVQDEGSQLDDCLGLLKQQGFEVLCEQQSGFAVGHRYLLYASKSGLKRDVKNTVNRFNTTAEAQNWDDPKTLALALKARVADYLPQVFHPADYVFTDSLPINANGKLVRKQLAEHPCLQVNTVNTEVGSGLSGQLAAIWQEVLATGTIFLEDNFYDLGGHSLKSVHIVNRIRRYLNIELSMADVLQHPVLGDFIAFVSKQAVQSVPQAVSVGGEQSAALLPMQKQIWFLAQLDDAATSYNMVRVIALQGILDVACLEQALVLRLQRHQALRTVFIPGDPVRQQVLDIDTAMARFTLSHSTDPRQGLLQQVMNTPFDLQRDLPFRAQLCELSPGHYQLLLSSHHIVCDGVSFEIIMDELFDDYRALLERDASGLPPLTASYLEVVGQLLDKIAAQSTAAMAYWQHHFQQHWCALALPLDVDRSVATAARSAVQSISLSAQTRSNLDTLARESRVSLFCLCLSVVKALLHRWTGSKEITVGSTVSGRDNARVARQVGYFANTIVLRDFVSGEDCFETLLAQVSQTVLKALQYPCIELDKVLGETGVIRRDGMAVLYDVGFTWYLNESSNDLDRHLNDSGLSAVVVPMSELPLRADMWFFIHDVDGTLVWDIIYNQAIFKSQTIVHFAELLHRLLDEVCAEPHRRIADYLADATVSEPQLDVDYELKL